MCTGDFDTPIPNDNRPKDFRGDASERTTASCSVSSERTRHVCSRFLFSNEPVVEISSTFDVLLI
jgi:hypothetical protein